MQSVRRYPLAVFALLALATGCSHAQHQAAAPVAPAVISPVVHDVAAAVEAAPAPVRLVTHTVAPAVAPVVAKPIVHRTATVRHLSIAVKPAAAKPAVVKPTAVAPAPVVRTSGDAYPYRTSTTNANDAWGFTQRQCVSYVAWRLSQSGRAISNADNWGSAYSWADAAGRLGFAVNSTPAVGAVAQWNAGESSAYYSSGSTNSNGSFGAGGYGHVAYVTAVYSDGSVQVSQYNAQGDRAFSSMHLRAPRYLHVG